MLIIFSCVSWPSLCLLWRNICLGLLTIFWLGCLFFWHWAAGALCRFWRLTPCQSFDLQIFSHILWLLFFFMVSFAVQNFLSLIRSHLFIFVFISIILGDWSYCCDLCQKMFFMCFPLVPGVRIPLVYDSQAGSLWLRVLLVHGLEKQNEFVY